MARIKSAIERKSRTFYLAPKAIAVLRELAYKNDISMSRIVEDLLLNEGKKKLTVRKPR